MPDFDTAPAPALTAALTACADVPSWVEALVAGRPWGSEAAVLAEADRRARAWTDEEVERCLAQHPRLGERSRAAGREADLSAAEQSALTGGGDDLASRLHAGNAAYEERFGRVFLLRARGRSGEEVLAALERRLQSDDAAEWAETREQLRQIALLRLDDLLAELRPVPVA